MSSVIKIILSLAIFGGLFGVVIPKTKSEKPIRLILILVIVCTALSFVFGFVSDISIPEYEYESYTDIAGTAEAERAVELKIKKIASEYGIDCGVKAYISDDFKLEKIVITKTSDERFLKKLKEDTGFDNILLG